MKMSCPLLEFYPSFDFLFKFNHSSQVPLCAHQMLQVLWISTMENERYGQTCGSGILGHN